MTSQARSTVWMILGFFSAACGSSAPQRAVPDQPRESTGVLQHEPRPKNERPAPLIVAVDEPPTAPSPPPAQIAAVSENDVSVSESDMATFASDPRPIRWSPRPTRLLVPELQSLERLLASAGATSPDRPKLLHRLAETYLELRSAALRDKTAAQALLDKPETSTRREQLQSEIVRAEKIMTAAQGVAVRHYTTLINAYPNACTTTISPDPLVVRVCLDEPLYYLGLELRQMGKSEEARRYLMQLIKDYPQSPILPRAYLAFGEFFFEEALADPSKWELARRIYEKVLEFPPPKNEIWGYTQFRLAQTLDRLQDKRAALNACVRALEFSTKFAGLRISWPLGIAARRGVIALYASVGKPQTAPQFFQRVSGDPPGQTARSFDMIDGLVDVYRREGRDADVAELCKDFADTRKAPASCRNAVAPSQIAK